MRSDFVLEQSRFGRAKFRSESAVVSSLPDFRAGSESGRTYVHTHDGESRNDPINQLSVWHVRCPVWCGAGSGEQSSLFVIRTTIVERRRVDKSDYFAKK